MNCPRCFYLDRKLGISPPPPYPFTLNSAVDTLLKKEFDIHRKAKTQHPIMLKNGLTALPWQHSDLDKWRDYHNGLTYAMPSLNFIVYGAPDDIWINELNELILVDYKATSSEKAVSMDDEWKCGYKRQIEIYQWLLKMNGYTVSNQTYFVYANATRHPETFNSELKFSLDLLGYDGNTDWIEPKLNEIHACLCGDMPSADPKCIDHFNETDNINYLSLSNLSIK